MSEFMSEFKDTLLRLSKRCFSLQNIEYNDECCCSVCTGQDDLPYTNHVRVI